MAAHRDSFGKIAFILALAGSAIGLGNIWRFPYMMGEHGGAAFLVVYLFCAVFISLPIMLCEVIIGRHGGGGTCHSLERIAPGSEWKHFGLITVISSFVIMSYYSVVGGWSIDYLVRATTDGFNMNSLEHAREISSHVFSSVWEPLIYHTLFLGISTLIVLAGVKKGIESFTKVTMPVLFLIIVVVLLYSISLPGAQKGIDYLVKPDWNKITPSCLASALGQSFFSMSLGVGCVLTYSSFSRKNDNIVGSSFWTMLFDTVFAVLAGFAIMPAVFAAGLEPGSGSTLVFETLPYIFSHMGINAPIVSRTISILFFFAILMAAMTSEISMVEVCIEHLVERKGFSRGKAAALVFLPGLLLGGLCSLSFGVLGDIKLLGQNIFGFCDIITSNFFMTIGALLFSVFVGWKMKKSAVREEFTNGGRIKFNAKIFDVFYFFARWIAPVMIFIIFITNLIL